MYHQKLLKEFAQKSCKLEKELKLRMLKDTTLSVADNRDLIYKILSSGALLSSMNLHMDVTE